jgi:hypothetical protein
MAGPKGLGDVCTSVGDVLSRAGFSPLLYTGGIVRVIGGGGAGDVFPTVR